MNVRCCWRSLALFLPLAGLLISLTGWLTPPSVAQDQIRDEPEEFYDRYNRAFDGRPPRVGQDLLEGLTAFDASGKPFEFAQLRGKHTVIVFGCLT